jgi:signal transduction histidine kinase
VLSPQLSYTLFRVAQETLHNAFQHAEADNVSLELQLEDSEAYLKITDDGTGFDVPRYLSSLARNYHFGLIGIDERLSLLGGKLQLESSEQGTTLIATVPLT